MWRVVCRSLGARVQSGCTRVVLGKRAGLQGCPAFAINTLLGEELLPELSCVCISDAALDQASEDFVLVLELCEVLGGVFFFFFSVLFKSIGAKPHVRPYNLVDYLWCPAP